MKRVNFVVEEKERSVGRIVCLTATVSKTCDACGNRDIKPAFLAWSVFPFTTPIEDAIQGLRDLAGRLEKYSEENP